MSIYCKDMFVGFGHEELGMDDLLYGKDDTIFDA
jgi:hypothetical protein